MSLTIIHQPAAEDLNRQSGINAYRGMSKCTCCQGTGWVLDATGERRPCSRCRAEDFNKWAKVRTELREAALMLAVAVTLFPILFIATDWLRHGGI